MSPIPVKYVPLSFIEKANQIAKYHKDKRKENPKWTLTDSSKELKISIGAVCEELLIAQWLRTHWDDMNKLDSRRDALKFIKERRRKLELED